MRLAIIFLSLMVTTFADEVPIQTAADRHHHHHNHHNDQQQILNNGIAKPTTLTSTIAGPSVTGQITTILEKRANNMPALPTLTTHTTSYSYQIDIPIGDKNSSPNYKTNPYIYSSKLPEGLVFIVVGSIIAFMLLSFISYRIISSVLSNRRAKTDKEVYYHNFNGGFGLFGGTSSTSSYGLTNTSSSSIHEKASIHSNSSMYMLSKHNSIIQSQFDDISNSSSSQPGRSYRDTVMGNNNSSKTNLNYNRGSMFISPVLEVMNGYKNTSQLELPMYHKSLLLPNNGSALSLLDPSTPTNDSVTNNDSVTYDPIEGGEKFNLLQSFANSDIESNIDSVNNKYPQHLPQQRQHKPLLSRPPSQYLEDILNGDSYLSES
ncbi:uncharacterized protein RJT20DRAFT_133729 [Scheffersomyces xylosifermentans]|uniref:uncharacterized protein n=1 Tax=Scheffersomyces xylosifermentans TaxID=1304137 RepID=UPI00315DFCEF